MALWSRITAGAGTRLAPKALSLKIKTFKSGRKSMVSASLSLLSETNIHGVSPFLRYELNSLI